MKKVYIIHGWGGNPDEPLHKWLDSELRKEEFEVEVPAMPNSDEPIIEAWVNTLNQLVGKEPNENVIFLGHSIGCQAILRYLAELETPGFFGGVVLIAPWFKVSGLETEDERNIVKPWVETTINYEKVLEHIHGNRIVSIFSDNDPFVPKENWTEFERFLGAKVIIESKKGHFTKEDGINNLSSALEAVLAMK